MIIEKRVESKSGGIEMLLEIVVKHDPVEYGHVGTLQYRVRGEVSLEEVNVLSVTGSDRNGEEVYHYDYRELSNKRLNHADEVAYDLVFNDFVDEGPIYQDIVEELV